MEIGKFSIVCIPSKPICTFCKCFRLTVSHSDFLDMSLSDNCSPAIIGPCPHLPSSAAISHCSFLEHVSDPDPPHPPRRAHEASSLRLPDRPSLRMKHKLLFQRTSRKLFPKLHQPDPILSSKVVKSLEKCVTGVGVFLL